MENEDMEFEEGPADRMKTWIQDNLRVIVSVFIVLAIALGIYSYSDRSMPIDEDTLAEDTASSVDTTEDENTVTENEEVVPAQPETKPAKENTVTPAETSRETETAFAETAVKGEGMTHLARKATAHYLEKNTDSSLTAEHKIYIEDYLRKAIASKDGVKVGTSVEFSKELIGQAIAKSKTLSEGQLKNLEQYSSRVAAFRK